MPPSIVVVNDTIVTAHGSYANITPRELNVHDAMYIFTLIGPLIGACFSLVATKHWYTPKKAFSFGVLSAAWFISDSIFATSVFVQRGETNRLTFMWAIGHGQVEVLLWLSLLNVRFTRALFLSWLWGLVMYLVNLTAESPATVFVIATITAGANDFAIPLLLAHAKLYTLALGATGHLLSVLIVFTNFVTYLSLVPTLALLFITTWLHIGAIVAGLFLLQNSEGDSPANPMFNIKIPKKVLLKIFGIAFASSTCVSLLLSYVVPA